MPKRGNAVHVSTHRRHYVGKDGVERDYETHLLRRSYREDGKVKNETVANLSHLPADLIEMIRASLAGQAYVPAAAAATVARSRPHGHVAAVHAQAKALGLPALLGPAGRDRDVALALLIARVCRPGSKLATTRWWADTTLADDLHVADATTDEVYAAMDWLAGQQDAIETKLVRTHLSGANNPDRLALFDLSSSWVTGRHCPLAARGYSRDGKKGLPQIEYGLLTDPVGRPVAVRVFPGNTADPSAFTTIVQAVKDTFKLSDMVMVGDRGMITSARVQELRELGGFGWVAALRAPAIAALAADDGPLQMSLFDQVNLAKIVAAVAAGTLAGAGKIGMRVGKVIGRFKMAKHCTLDITNDRFVFTRNQDAITAEAALDGLYVIRTTVGPEQMNPAKVVATYKSLVRVERDFRSLKAIDVDLRPIHHYTETRVRAHVFICMLAAHLAWHLRQAWAPLTFTDEQRPDPADPVAPAQRSHAADHKAATKTTTDDQPATSFTPLLDHLAALPRNPLRVAGHDESGFDLLAIPPPTGRRAFELISA